MAVAAQSLPVSVPTTAELRSLASTYEQHMPFAGVESAMFETIGAAISSDALRWRDVEWMVRWYYRRHLSSRYNEARQSAEDAFRTNDWPEVSERVERAAHRSGPVERINVLTPLAGVDVGIASAILYFSRPDRDIVLGEPEWAALARWETIDEAFPEALTASSYGILHSAVLEISQTRSVDLITLQRALFIAATEQDS